MVRVRAGQASPRSAEDSIPMRRRGGPGRRTPAGGEMTQLARKLRVTDYFSLGWGTMVGVGWLVVMDDWLGRGGPLGAVLGFGIGGALLLPIGYVYGQLVAAMP